MNDQTLNLWRQIESSRRRGRKQRQLPTPANSNKPVDRA
jgi:hypothetical protein